MNITVNAEVYCSDGFYGHVTRIIVNPATEAVTYVVVQQQGLFSHTWLVPIGHIIRSTSGRAELDLSTQAVKSQLRPFIKTEYLAPDLPDTLYTDGFVWQHLIANLELKTLEHENVPLHELALHQGSVVQATDGIIGHLQQIVMNDEDKHITQIVIRAGRWLAHSQFAVPVAAIDHFAPDAIFLAVNKQEAEALAVA